MKIIINNYQIGRIIYCDVSFNGDTLIRVGESGQELYDVSPFGGNGLVLQIFKQNHNMIKCFKISCFHLGEIC